MKNLLLALMLVIMGQRWESIGEGFVLHRWCSNDSVALNPCSEPFKITESYRLLYVIGEVETDMSCLAHLQFNCRTLHERFTIPVPNTPTKAMSKEEAEAANKKLE